MRNILFPLTMMVLMLAGTPVAAQQSSQTVARAQVTASARIISGESIRFDGSTAKAATKQGPNGKIGLIISMARTRGEVVFDGQPHVWVTEFH